MIIEVVLCIFSVFLPIWWLLCPPGKMRELGNKIPGPVAYPLFGNVLNFKINGPQAIPNHLEARKKYGPILRAWFGPQLHIFLADANDIQMLLSSTTKITKSFTYKILEQWLGTGLLISTGELWHKRRKAITPTFHFKILDDFVPIFNRCADTLVDILKEKSGKEEFDVTPFISNCALDTVSQSAMGVEMEAQTKPNAEYVTSNVEMTKLLSLKVNKPWFGLEPFYSLSGQKSEEKKHLKILQNFAMKVLNEKKREVESKTGQQSLDNEFGIKRRSAFLELLLETWKNKPPFEKDQDILDEVKTFMFEGHDTTTSCLSFTLWLLGQHPDIQEDVYKEVSSIVNGGQEIKMGDLQKMKYLERVIKESLRIYPTVPLIGRKLHEDTLLPSGYIIPAGAEVYASIIVIHRDPQYFQDPDLFNPDRFLSEMKHPYCYIPFSAGPRNCIGQKYAMTEVKIILAKLILKYKMHSTEKPQLDLEMVLRSINDIKIKITPR